MPLGGWPRRNGRLLRRRRDVGCSARCEGGHPLGDGHRRSWDCAGAVLVVRYQCDRTVEIGNALSFEQTTRMELKKLNVDLDEIAEAMQQGGDTLLEMSWHLDTQ